MGNRELIRKCKIAGIFVELYQFRMARKATLVRFPDGICVRFIDRIPTSMALRQALEHRAWELN